MHIAANFLFILQIKTSQGRHVSVGVIFCKIIDVEPRACYERTFKQRQVKGKCKSSHQLGQPQHLRPRHLLIHHTPSQIKLPNHHLLLKVSLKHLYRSGGLRRQRIGGKIYIIVPVDHIHTQPGVALHHPGL